MRTGRPKQPLMLTDEERERLESPSASGAHPAAFGAAGSGGAGVCRGAEQSKCRPETALLVGHGGQVARAIFESFAWKDSTTSPRPGAPRKVSDAEIEASRYSDLGKHTKARRDALVHTRFSEGHWT